LGKWIALAQQTLPQAWYLPACFCMETANLEMGQPMVSRFSGVTFVNFDQDGVPRELANINNDGFAAIVGFGFAGVLAGLNQSEWLI
jgi:hypothetical protein